MAGDTPKDGNSRKGELHQNEIQQHYPMDFFLMVDSDLQGGNEVFTMT